MLQCIAVFQAHVHVAKLSSDPYSYASLQKPDIHYLNPDSHAIADKPLGYTELELRSE